MPVPRRTTRHCEQVEEHGGTLVRVCRTVEEVTADGRVDAEERQLLRDVMVAHQRSYAPLLPTACCVDNAFRLIGTLAQTAEVTAWVRRVAREAAEDEARLDEAA